MFANMTPLFKKLNVTTQSMVHALNAPASLTGYRRVQARQSRGVPSLAVASQVTHHRRGIGRPSAPPFLSVASRATRRGLAIARRLTSTS